MSRRKAAGKHRLVRPKKEVRSRCGDCTKRGLVGALVVPLAILAGASFDSFTKAPDAVANVMQSVGADEPQTVSVTTTVAIPVRPERAVPEPAAAAVPDAVVTASSVEQPAIAVPQETVSEALDAKPCVTARGPEQQEAPKEPPAASMSVDVRPGRSGSNREGHEEFRPGPPVRCG